MPHKEDIECWKDTIRTRYLNYLKTSFYFKDPNLRNSFDSALNDPERELVKGPIPESAHHFQQGIDTHALVRKCFPKNYDDILPALFDKKLYDHQEQAIRQVHNDQQNVVVATGTASGKTESFLYPILFELYREYLNGTLDKPGVRALILYPMNALANDQRRRMGEICNDLNNNNSGFKPTFGQYIGATPKNKDDTWRNGKAHKEKRLDGELVFREEMRKTPPHILMTNYSMLEYLLIRPEDSELFDGNRGEYWQFIVLDEAHQYRGAKGMEMGMLVRRLKQRLRDGGRGQQPFRCIATSATISSGEGDEDKNTVATFSETLFGEAFTADNVIFGRKQQSDDTSPQRFHLFMGALEGAFLSHKDGEDRIILNRNTEGDDESSEQQYAALEIALCRECGQHYYVGQEKDARLTEAIRDPSHEDFGVDFYLPVDENMEVAATHHLCRQCGAISNGRTACECDASIAVKKCTGHAEHPDQIKQCETCNYRGGSDPVQEIVHGSDGPNSVIATALHTLLSKQQRQKILSFVDSRQEAAFFAWYAQHSYEEIRDRNFILRALKKSAIDKEGLSLDDLKNRLQKILQSEGLFSPSDTSESQRTQSLGIICRELVTSEQRNALGGVGLAKWSVHIPENFKLPQTLFEDPWSFTEDEGRELLSFLLDRLRYKQAMELPEGSPPPADVFQWSQQAVTAGTGGGRYTFAWSSPDIGIVKHFLFRLLADCSLSSQEKRNLGKKLLEQLWDSIIIDFGRAISNEDNLLVRARIDGSFRLNPDWLRVKLPSPDECFQCDTCAQLSFYNIRSVCPRNGCPGNLAKADHSKPKQNHYRVLYEDRDMPARLRAEEHTAQVHSEEAQIRQQKFIDGEIDLLSSSTTFEVGVDLGDLEVAFLRNVPPETFNYTQRVGRVGRGEIPGLALTYCRRNPHDLYHYADPETRILQGEIRPPQLRMQNGKIILRHVAAMALSAFFKENGERFKDVECLIGEDWENRRAVADVRKFCRNNTALEASLRDVVPVDMHEKIGLHNGTWVDEIAGEGSRFADAEREVCDDYNRMNEKRQDCSDRRDYRNADQIDKRMKTISTESSLAFLSRKAIIPKYGFPVDVVELDTRPTATFGANKISLQRDLSQAIAEYAPGAKVVANKKEWESCGVKIVHGKELEVKNYAYNQAREFTKWNENDPKPDSAPASQQYLVPQFGFVTKLFKIPTEPKRRAQRLYTTRPFFEGFEEERPSKNSFGIKITPASPGRMVVLCEGKNGGRFYICRRCGAGSIERAATHQSPENNECRGRLEHLALGHEFVTDVVRLQFPGLTDHWVAYSLAYALLLGVSQTLNVPDTDLNATITAGEMPDETAIVLYDNVPGGAGLVASLENSDILKIALAYAVTRVNGECGCTESCYGCIRSYRNQFVHPYLRRATALEFLENALENATAEVN